MPLTPLLLITVLLGMVLVAKHKSILKESHYKSFTEGHWESRRNSVLALYLELVVGTKTHLLIVSENGISHSPKT